MKNLIISLSLISSLLIAQSAFANDQVSKAAPQKNIETIVVTSTPEVANFEIFGLDVTQEALDSAMKMVSEKISASVTKGSVSLVETTVKHIKSI